MVQKGRPDLGDPVELIASGPTVDNGLTSEELRLRASDVVRKHQIDVPDSVRALLEQPTRLTSEVPKPSKKRLLNVHNFVIANNKTAVTTCARRLRSLVQSSQIVLLEEPLVGDCRKLAEAFSKLAIHLNNRSHELESETSRSLGWTQKHEMDFEEFVANPEMKHFCIVGGGETTARVRGLGKGGRNQEMALVVAKLLDENIKQLTQHEVVFMSGGTDGIDGPTDAAGAVVDIRTCGQAKSRYDHKDAFFFSPTL